MLRGLRDQRSDVAEEKGVGAGIDSGLMDRQAQPSLYAGAKRMPSVVGGER